MTLESAPHKPSGDEILEVLRLTLQGMENYPSPFLMMDEENLRGIVVSHLNTGLKSRRATAETRNGQGKTDILIPDGTRNAFIAECKVYGGPDTIKDGVAQLLGYVGWRDPENDLIVFVRSASIFHAVKAVRDAGNRAGSLVSRVTDLTGDGGEVLLHGTYPDDPDREFTIRCHLVHLTIPRGTKGQMQMMARPLRPEDLVRLTQELQRSMPPTSDVEYTPVVGSEPPTRARDQSWVATYLATAGDGVTGGISAAPTSVRGAREHAPTGALVAPDAASARYMNLAIRNAHRNNVRVQIRGVGFRIDRIAPGLRDSADGMERAAPEHTVVTYGPTDLWQCTVTFESDQPSISYPVAFAVLEPKSGWDATVRGTVFDASLTMSLRRDSRDVEIEWHLGPRQGSVGEHLAALRFALALTQPGVMKITSEDEGYGNGEFDRDGPVDQGLVRMYQVWNFIATVSEHLGYDLPVPQPASDEWIQQVARVATALHTRHVPVNVEGLSVTQRVSAGEDPLVIGDVLQMVIGESITMPIADLDVDLGDAQLTVDTTITAVEPAGGNDHTYLLTPVHDGPFAASLVVPEDHSGETDSAVTEDVA